MKTMTQKVILGTLLLAALVLGFLLINKQLGLNSTSTDNNPPPQTGSNFQTPSPSKATAEELKKLLAGPGQNPTAPQFKNYNESVSVASVPSLVLDLTGCNPTPNVLRLKLGDTVFIQNRDATAHRISNGPSADKLVEIYSAPPNSEQKVSLKVSGGIIGYVCDEKGPAVGMIFVDATSK